MKRELWFTEDGILSKEALDFVNQIKAPVKHRTKIIADIIWLKAMGLDNFIECVYLFGSCSKGGATLSSDVDMGIFLREDLSNRSCRYIRATLRDDTELDVETNVVFLSNRVDLSERLYQEIMKGVKLYE